MTKLRDVVLALCLSLGVLVAPTLALAQSGSTVWGAWDFDWEVKNSAGLNIRFVNFDNELVLWKASLPVIRVKYDGNGCGPYADRITGGNLVNISNCGNNKVCQRSFTSGGRNWLELGVLAKIGQYRIYQAWYFSHDGWIAVRAWMRGLQCNIDHDHHAYWRLDFDVGGAAFDQAFVYDSDRPNQGWGPGWLKYTRELNDVKNPATNRKWFARDDRSENGVWVYPGPGGEADSFSTKDIGVRRYHGSEDEPWPFGAWGSLGYNNGEDVAETDIVFWYVDHLFHPAAEGADQWEWVGPWLLVER